MHYTEISQQILTSGYYETDGATPSATVNSVIAVSIAKEGEHSPFVRVGRGTFTLRNVLEGKINQNHARVPLKQERPETLVEKEVEEAGTVIRSFGMYWQRDLVVWRNDAKIYGKQQATASPVDFGGQRGIYILYDQHAVVYVGRSIDRPLGKRLFEHTTDRLGGRWNRFSWFGLLEVTNEGILREVPLGTSLASLIATLEALLIEALEPPQNRRRGDDFSAVEYIQDIDPELREREIQNTLRAIEQKLRGS